MITINCRKAPCFSYGESVKDKDTMLVFKIQKDMKGISTLSFNGHIDDSKFNEIMQETEDDLLNLLYKIENILNKK